MANVFRKTNELPKNPQLTVFIHAPGIICFNKEENRAEAGLLQLADHEYYVSLHDKSGRILKKTITWDVTTIGNNDDGTIKFFDSKTDDDFDKMFELTGLYGNDIVILPDPDQWNTKFFFHNMVFATAPDSVVNATPIPLVPGDPVLKTRPVGRTVMLLSNGKLDHLDFGGEKVMLKDKEQYELVVKGSGCRSKTGDFKYIHDVLGKTGRDKYNLKYPDGTTPWFSPAERAFGGRFLSKAGDVLNRKISDLKIEDHGGIADYLEDIFDGFRCDGVACQKAVIKTKSLSLP